MERLSPADEYPKTIPQGTWDLNSSNITCGRRAFDWAAKTETADVLAGSEVGFRVSWSLNEPLCPRIRLRGELLLS
jgi:hypothetical protein